MQPSVTKERGPALKKIPSFHLKKINATRLDLMFHGMEEWYDAMVEVIVKQGPWK